MSILLLLNSNQSGNLRGVSAATFGATGAETGKGSLVGTASLLLTASGSQRIAAPVFADAQFSLTLGGNPYLHGWRVVDPALGQAPFDEAVFDELIFETGVWTAQPAANETWTIASPAAEVWTPAPAVAA